MYVRCVFIMCLYDEFLELTNVDVFDVFAMSSSRMLLDTIAIDILGEKKSFKCTKDLEINLWIVNFLS